MNRGAAWEPTTETEVALYDALLQGDQEKYFRALTRVELLLPVSADALAGRSPMGWATWTSNDHTHLLAFTSTESMRTCLAEHAGAARRLALPELAVNWPNQDWWLAINPGLPIEGYLPSWFVAQLGRGDARLPSQISATPRDRLERVQAMERAKAARAAGRTGRDHREPVRVTATVAPRALPAPGQHPLHQPLHQPQPTVIDVEPVRREPEPVQSWLDTTPIPPTEAPRPWSSPPVTAAQPVSLPPPVLSPPPTMFEPATVAEPIQRRPEPAQDRSWSLAEASAAAPARDRSRSLSESLAAAQVEDRSWSLAEASAAAPAEDRSWSLAEVSAAAAAAAPAEDRSWSLAEVSAAAPVPAEDRSWSLAEASAAAERKRAAKSVPAEAKPWVEPAAPRPWEEPPPVARPWEAPPAAAKSWQEPAPAAARSWEEPAPAAPRPWQEPAPAAVRPWEEPAPAAARPWEEPVREEPAKRAWEVAPPTAEVIRPWTEPATVADPVRSWGATAEPVRDEASEFFGANGHARHSDSDPDFVPANSVEEALFDAAEAGNTDAFLSTLLLATVLIPKSSGTTNGAWRPQPIDGEPHIVCYTSTQHFEDPLETVSIKFIKLINSWPDPSWSFAVNPGTPVGATLPGGQLMALASWAAEVGLGREDDENEPVAAGAPAAGRVSPELTVLQKVIAPSQASYYLERGYDRVSGFVHRAHEVGHLRSVEQMSRALGLDWEGSPFVAGADAIYLLRWSAYRPNLYRIPYGGQHEAAMKAMEGWVIERAPFRGNGFAPGESKEIIAEFKVDSARLPHGARLLRLRSDGQEELIAILDTDGLRWLRTDGGS